MKAARIFDRVWRILQDQGYTRWPLAELALWLNDAQREIVIFKPDAVSETISLAMREGTRQAVPEKAVRFLRAVRNLKSEGDASGGRPIRVCDRESLDSQTPDWHDRRFVRFRKEVRNVIFDQADPRTFYVYPGNDGSGLIEIVVSVIPDEVPENGSSIKDYENVDIGLRSIYANAITDYVLYRAFSKDMQMAGAAQRAQAHYNLFQQSLGIKTQRDAIARPDVKPDGVPTA